MKKLITSLLFIASVIVADAQTPTVEWVKQLGSAGQGKSVVVNAAGDVYSTGYFSGTQDFNPGTGVFNLTSGFGYSAYISKLDSAGNFIWAKMIKSDLGFVDAEYMTIDASGNIYITGFFNDTTDFDPGTGVYNLIANPGNFDAFILKLNPAGDFTWAKNIGGAAVSVVKPSSITIDHADNIYITGGFFGTADFDPGSAVFNLSATPDSIMAYYHDVFITKLDSAGNFIWAKKISETFTSYDYGFESHSITADASGNVYITGNYDGSADFNPGVGIDSSTSVGFCDMYILKLDSDGSFVWVKNLSGTSYGRGYSITLDNAGNIYTTGDFNGTVDFDPGATVLNLTSITPQAFILKLDASGNFVWAKNVRETGHLGDGSLGYSIKSDMSGNVYFTGDCFGKVDFDPGTDTAYWSLDPGVIGMFISEFDSEGNLIWVKPTTGMESIHNVSKDIAVDAAKNVYTTGYFNDEVDFDPGSGMFDLTSSGEGPFVEKINTHTPTSGILVHGNKINIYVYPNPASDKLTIDMDAAEPISSVAIINVLGETIYSDVLKNVSGKQSEIIDVSSLSKGVYFIQLKNKNSVSSKKFVKE